MSSRFLLAVIAIAALSSCSTTYKAQTPDDVYYSPAKPQEEYVRVETQKDREAYNYDDEYSDDRWLRWKVRNRTRWSAFDAYSYDYDWYDYRYSNWSSYNVWNRNNYWYNYWYWNNSYNPYCRQVIVVNPKSPVATPQVRNYRPGTYKGIYSNTNNTFRTKTTSPGVYRNNSYNNSNRSGSTRSKVFNNSSSSDSRPNRTYTPPSSNSSSNNSGSRSGSSGSGSSGGGGPVSRPSRGG
ncbi:MAG TPA: hypothetical protein VD996_09685 [Chitinophagaceae bacterium]|nr:hypothetical protein [Chitinophagaceae bacterium]